MRAFCVSACFPLKVLVSASVGQPFKPSNRFPLVIVYYGFVFINVIAHRCTVIGNLSLQRVFIGYITTLRFVSVRTMT